MTPALLVLADGRVFRGEACGAEGETHGEVVFNTAMTGYQEILTDPSYRGQVVSMTYPLIGNYGINEEDVESRRPWVAGFIVKEACPYPSSWRGTVTLDAYLKRWTRSNPHDSRNVSLFPVHKRAIELLTQLHCPLILGTGS